jgi:hypothetical protein
MMRLALLSCLLLAGCSTLHQRSDYFETQFRGLQAMEGDTAAFDRVASLQAGWERRGEAGALCGVISGGKKNRQRSALLAEKSLRVVKARDAVLSQRETTEVMINAFSDLESEYDALVGLLTDSDAPVAVFGVVSEQKYLIRRMANSLVMMAQADMTNAVEAADLFGRDVAKFQNLLDAAINGDDELGIDPPENPEVEDSLAQIEELFSGYVADSAPDMLDNVAYRYDAWLALGEMAAMGDGREARLAPAGNVAPASQNADAMDEISGDDAETKEGERVPGDGDAGAEADPAMGAEPVAEDGDAVTGDEVPAADGDGAAAVDEPAEDGIPADEAMDDEGMSAAGDDAGMEDMEGAP